MEFVGRRMMTKSELSQYYYLQRESKRQYEKIQELEAKAQAQSPSLSGMPGNAGVSDKVGQYSAEIADLQAMMELNIRKSWPLLARLQRYINDIPDSLTRQIFWLRHAECKSWQQVANEVGGGNTASAVRMIHDRYLNSH